MPAPSALDFSNAAGADKALKQIKTLMIRAGQPVISTEFSDKPKRSNGVTYREATLALASGQQVTLRVTGTGDVYQVLLNGAVKPIKAHDDVTKAVGEIAAMADKNQAAFQKAQARKQVELPPGMTTPAPKMDVVLGEQLSQLDSQIAEKKATVADLRQQLGAMTDSTSGEPPEASDASQVAAREESQREAQGIKPVLLDNAGQEAAVMVLAGTYVAAREIVAADPAMLDNAATAGAVAQLRIALDVVETNQPINRAAGNLDQANLEAELAQSFRFAIAMLDSAGAELTDAGLAQLVAIAQAAAAEDTDITDQDALAQLLALGLVETAEGLYMATAQGKSALDDAGYDPYGEPYAAGD